jgi:hypothetical protein
MSTFITIVGWLCVALALIIAAGVIVLMVITAGERLMDRIEARGETRARREIYERITATAYWFGEDPVTYSLLRTFADRVVRGTEYDANGIREEWRESRRSTQKTEGLKS